ncbi:hypothetical protein [Nonomuraea sp. NPDC049695]
MLFAARTVTAVVTPTFFANPIVIAVSTAALVQAGVMAGRAAR